MRTYDITLTISPDLVVWPGDPPIELERVSKIEDGAKSNISRLSMSAHTGTHIDAPYHFLENGGTVEDIPIKFLTGRAYVLHVPDVEVITAELLEKSPIPPRTRRVLFRTRNSEHWTKPHKTFDTKYVAVAPDAAEWLIQKRGQIGGRGLPQRGPVGRLGQHPSGSAEIRCGHRRGLESIRSFARALHPLLPAT